MVKKIQNNSCVANKHFHGIRELEFTFICGLWDSKLTWYSLNAIQQFCRKGFEYHLRIYDFRLIWLCLIVEVLATQVKFFNHLVTVLWSTAFWVVTVALQPISNSESSSYWIRQHCKFICEAFKSYTWSERKGTFGFMAYQLLWVI